MKKILIIGPFEDYGGRELEAGFIASRINKNYNIDVISTANLSVKSQIFQFESGLNVKSIKQILYKKYLMLKPATLLSYFRNGRKEPVYFYVNNRYNSIKVRKKEKELLSEIILKFDLVIIVAHLFTLRTRELIESCERNKIPVIFRTTGEINFNSNLPNYLKNVTHFIHHSIKNARRLHKKLSSVAYSVIDQTAFYEDQLLKIPDLNREVSNFLVVGRLSPEKNIVNLVSFFKACSKKEDNLLIVGEGDLDNTIKTLIGDSKNIKMTGHLSQQEMINVYENSHCLIIPSYSEAGPLVGIEAMASGRLILSSKVGAMPERLKDSHNDFWIYPNNEDTFRKQFERIKRLNFFEIAKISKMNRSIYLEKYATEKISESYLSIISNLLKKYN